MADRRKNKYKSPYTADRNMPGAFEGETVTRRRFMLGAGQAAGGVAVAAFALPALGFAVGPLFDRHEVLWQDIGPESRFTENDYLPVVFTETEGIGEIGKTTAYVRKHNPALDQPVKDELDHYVAVSTRCMHLGCPVRYINAAQRFVCPCHGGVYNFQGEPTGGPPVRPLDRFYTRIRNGRVEVGPRYSVNRELKRFSPRDPAEDLDGIGPILYPPRFSTAKIDTK